MQKRVIAVHDISCVGKCSLTVALPILSAAGIETSVLPTAVLSTHTGGFTGYTFRDLTEDIAPILRHWESLDLHTDAVYTGYLGSKEQIRLVQDLFGSPIAKDSFLLVDPVMADNGKLYPAFDAGFPKEMAKLCRMADMIVPNLTEASLLLERPYRESYSKEEIETLLHDLSELGPRYVVLTGVSLEKGKLGAAAYDKENRQSVYYFADAIEGSFHGTGDIFGSTLLAAVLQKKPLGDCLRIAVEFTVGSILRTVKAGTDRRYGVDFENGLGQLIAAIEG